MRTNIFDRPPLDSLELGDWSCIITAAKKGSLREAPMATDSKMVEYAAECLRLADTTSDPIIREQMLRMARLWKEAATGSKQEQLCGRARVMSVACNIVSFGQPS